MFMIKNAVTEENINNAGERGREGMIFSIFGGRKEVGGWRVGGGWTSRIVCFWGRHGTIVFLANNGNKGMGFPCLLCLLFVEGNLPGPLRGDGSLIIRDKGYRTIMMTWFSMPVCLFKSVTTKTTLTV